MAQYVARRLIWAVPTVLGVVVIIFVLLRLMPGDPALIVLGDYAEEQRLRELRHELGVDKPVYQQFGDYVAGIARGDLGRSLFSRQPVTDEIRRQFPYTLQLAVASVLIAVLVGVPLGALSAVKRNTGVDHLTRVLAMFCVSAPNFWLALMLLWLFGMHLRWLPIIGAGQAGDPLAMIRALVLPSLVLGLGMAGLLVRMTRSCMLEVINQDYIRTARAKGLVERSVIFQHALKNAMIPVVTIVGLDIGRLLGGAIVIEMVFGRPGLGKLLIDAISTHDYPQAQASSLVLALSFVLVNLVTDVLYGFFDPRIKYS